MAADDLTAANRVLDAIDSRWRQRLHHPYSVFGRDDRAPCIRHLAVGNYPTLYRLIPRQVEIVRILHGRRKLGRRTAERRNG
ncbi:type II toxin-antitoxin system RelE/ParE family toxin [Pararhizobium sp. A13]|uniref:type II toxin-antitoxin system RelE/ParE family toxin n=1 Tax=Pararhizobium sp. A13 TaxID=3133975 RepID=UPI00311AD358